MNSQGLPHTVLSRARMPVPPRPPKFVYKFGTEATLRNPTHGRILVAEVSNFIGAPGVNRTPNLLVRSQPLYPIELRAHGFRETMILQKSRIFKNQRLLPCPPDTMSVTSTTKFNPAAAKHVPGIPSIGIKNVPVNIAPNDEPNRSMP